MHSVKKTYETENTSSLTVKRNSVSVLCNKVCVIPLLPRDKTIIQCNKYCQPKDKTVIASVPQNIGFVQSSWRTCKPLEYCTQPVLCDIDAITDKY